MLFELPPVSLKQFEKFFQNWSCEANAAGENSASVLTVGVKSVPPYHFKLAYVVLQMAIKEFFETHFQKWKNRPT